ncbi:hypothetical protein Pelo_11650 [Pelomyxa schiedti]|nr:hypothetical protein Pelo_11650 [Pelomyxa schiedti]
MVMEMVDGSPPFIQHPPLNALILIAAQTTPPPPLNPSDWTALLTAFTTLCLDINPSNRPTATALLHHPLLAPFSSATATESSTYLQGKQQLASLIVTSGTQNNPPPSPTPNANTNTNTNTSTSTSKASSDHHKSSKKRH